MNGYGIIFSRKSLRGDKMSACVISKDNKRVIVAFNLLSKNPSRTDEIAINWFLSSNMNIGFERHYKKDSDDKNIKKILSLNIQDMGDCDFQTKLHSIKDYEKMPDELKIKALYVEDADGSIIVKKFFLDKE